uniref:Uncharacterized protein n=1 Tax=Arundo donax TaxID=35708 RepID=A0A0A9BM89_ARUDO
MMHKTKTFLDACVFLQIIRHC